MHGTDTQQFETNPASQSVLANTTATLDCVTGYSAPPADVHWLHDDIRVTTGRLVVTEFGSRRNGGTSGQRNASLRLDGVSLEDGGYYACVSVNPLSGQQVRSLKAYLNVTGTTYDISLKL